MRYLPRIAWLLIVLAFGFGAEVRALTVARTRCEYLAHPLGIDSPIPRLSWTLESSRRAETQTAYRILVASDSKQLSVGKADLWDSAKVTSEQSVHVPYGGAELSSGQRCYWSVRVWDKEGHPSRWSKPATWTMGLLRPEDWKASWIGFRDPTPHTTGLPIFRKEFSVAKPVRRATVHVCGLGHYELFLNGRKVGKRFLDPAWSVYEKTVYYTTYDITDHLREGRNTFGVMLGKGFYDTFGDRRIHGVSVHRPLVLILQASIEYTDGTDEQIVTDSSWKATAGPVTHNAILGGSDYDARLLAPGWDQSGFDDSSWAPAHPTRGPGGKLVASLSPPMLCFDNFPAVKVDEPEPGYFVYDFGQNASARPRVRVRGAPGQRIRLTPAEQRHGQTDNANNGTGRVDQSGIGKPQYWEYTLRGGEEELWAPQFQYSGYQYLELTGGVPAGAPNPNGLPVVTELVSVHVRNAARSVGAFECSKPLFNKIDRLIDWAVRSNMSHVLTDCPHREKLGWLEVSYLMGPSIAWRYDIARFYAKVSRDIRDSQADSGEIFTIAPNYPKFQAGFRYTPEWGAAGVLLPWQLYQWYGDRQALTNNYDAMRRFVDYMKETSTDLIAAPGLGDWYDYSPGLAPGPSRFTPPELSATATFYLCTRIVSQTAKLLDKNADQAKYEALAHGIRKAFNQAYFNGQDSYANHGSPQTADAMALVAGLVDPKHQEAVIQNLIADIRKRGNQQTSGDIGHRYLLTALRQHGRSDVIFDMTDRDQVGSYGRIVQQGWTTMPEAWDALLTCSMNHCMLGHIQEWFQQGLVGIAPDPTTPGFKKIIIKPRIVGDLTWVTGHHDCMYGRIANSWQRNGDRLRMDVVIPPNTSATVFVPARSAEDVSESGRPASSAPAVEFRRMEEGRAVFVIGSGQYHFKTSNVNK